MTTDLERFGDCMEYRPSDRRPNHELGAWRQTRERWRGEAPDVVARFDKWWNWFRGEPELGLDRREFIRVNYGFLPPFEREVLEETEDYEIARDAKGIVTKALKAGTVDGGRMCMDQHLKHPIEKPEDWPAVRARLVAALPERYPPDLDEKVEAWKARDCPLVLGENCAANGFYWRAREFLSTEGLSYAWYDYPEMMHEIMEFFADFLIETSRPVLERLQVDYFTFNEDLSMKSGPLLSPQTFREFILPHMKRVCDFLRARGTRYIAVDTDGDPTVLIPLFLEAGVDTLWPVERASEVSPLAWRRAFGRDLRLWGGVDKRVLPRGEGAMRAHLLEMAPLVEEGGFIPTVDHTVPPDVSWDDFRRYMDAKRDLLAGEFGRLG